MLLIAVTQIQFAYLAVTRLVPIKSSSAHQVKVANDQHQPANSRAIATLATT